MTQLAQTTDGNIKRLPICNDIGKRTLIMGILNVTPDSFSDGGKYNRVDLALSHAVEMVEAGADLIDLGAESTRPNHTPVSALEEWDRLREFLPALQDTVRVPLSVDTYKAEVAWHAVEAGVKVINDVWGGAYDPLMFDVVAQTGVPYVLMHNVMGLPKIAGNVVEVVYHWFEGQIEKAQKAGIQMEQIILDPGIGFGKTLKQNLELLNHLDRFQVFGRPLLVGTSRKSMIGTVLDLPVQERIEGTAATVAIAIARGADIVRVHDVKEMARVVKMTDSMVR